MPFVIDSLHASLPTKLSSLTQTCYHSCHFAKSTNHFLASLSLFLLTPLDHVHRVCCYFFSSSPTHSLRRPVTAFSLHSGAFPPEPPVVNLTRYLG